MTKGKGKKHGAILPVSGKPSAAKLAHPPKAGKAHKPTGKPKSGSAGALV